MRNRENQIIREREQCTSCFPPSLFTWDCWRLAAAYDSLSHLDPLVADSCVLSLAHMDQPLLVRKTGGGVGPRASDSRARLAQGRPTQESGHQDDVLRLGGPWKDQRQK